MANRTSNPCNRSKQMIQGSCFMCKSADTVPIMGMLFIWYAIIQGRETNLIASVLLISQHVDFVFV